MHRQSLGSPAAKLHSNGVITIKESSSSSSSSPLSSSSSSSSSSELVLKKLPNNDEEDEKTDKKLHKTAPSRSPEKFIHLIPVLTLFCILVLYLVSHDPSQIELAQFGGLKTLKNSRDTRTEMEEIQGLSEIREGDSLAIRRARNLQGLLVRDKENRLNRKMKIGDF